MHSGTITPCTNLLDRVARNLVVTSGTQNGLVDRAVEVDDQDWATATTRPRLLRFGISFPQLVDRVVVVDNHRWEVDRGGTQNGLVDRVEVYDHCQDRCQLMATRGGLQGQDQDRVVIHIREVDRSGSRVDPP